MRCSPLLALGIAFLARVRSRSSVNAVAWLLLVSAVASMGCEFVPPPPVSNVRTDERVIVFDTDARYDPENDVWVIPVHAWVFEPEDSVVRKGVAEAALRRLHGLEVTDEARSRFDRRIAQFLVDNERGKHLVVEIGDERFEIDPTEPNGHVRDEVTLSGETVRGLATGVSLNLRIALPVADGRVFEGHAHLVTPAGLGIISDIDDTIKISEVTDTTRLLKRTFLDDFEAVPGMADRYRDWAATGASVHFVSSSPWQLYETLHAFTNEADFPAASFSLKTVRLKDDTIWDLFKSGDETKPQQIEPILDAYPERRFVLIGDSGEEDPEVYADLARRHPDRIAAIFIRNVTDALCDDDRFAEAFRDVDPGLWRLFEDPGALTLPD